MATESAMAVTVEAEPSADVLRAWDELVERTEGADVAQLSAWSTVRRQAGCTARYVLVRHGGPLVAGALVLQRRLPLLGTVGYVSYGPVVAPGPDRAAAVGAVGDALAGLRGRLSGLFVAPPVGGHEISDYLLRAGFRPSTAGIGPAASIRLDLTGDLDGMLARLGRRHRQSIRNAAARGVAVRPGTETDLPLVAELLSHTAERNRFEPQSLDYLRTLHRELARDGHIRLLLAEVDREPVAMGVYTCCGGTVTARLTGMRRDDRARKADAVRVLDWTAIRWAQANGYRTFDFGGIPAAAVDAIGSPSAAGSLSGATKFKASFGGEPFHYPPAVESIRSLVLRAGYDGLRAAGSRGDRIVEWARRLMRGGTQPRSSQDHPDRKARR